MLKCTNMNTDDNGWETGARLEPVIAKLAAWQREVEACDSPDAAQRAERISLRNRIDTAIQLLRRCDEFEIAPGELWDRIPDIVHGQYLPEIRIVDDRESDDPQYWQELPLASGHAVRMRGGEVVIGGNRVTP
jgi:hypothetical protein